ncbi:hypothetical protein K470DRAFT_266132 [Piedraia hortae CBS 480.64]|uniref:Uncharacterized protein n=1 Tax=Piedraia hortae CBS 480.64 TaxID=1314780 RepID=A0A6A7BST4_9PEZI|nr:hypothetical protein K470DRAFT_266132 [Piedraia hortae CBS 480.64]
MLRIDGRWVWVGVGAFALMAAYYAANAVARPIEREHEEEGDDWVLEDEIELDALRTLTEYPDRSVSEAATRIIVQRYCRFGLLDEELNAMKSAESDERRERASKVVALVRDYHPLPVNGWENVRQPLGEDVSDNPRETRRRRREAMVYHPPEW